MAYKLKITFNEDLPAEAWIQGEVYKLDAVVGSVTEFNIVETWKPVRSAPNQVEVGVPTSVVGERSAINFANAIILDYATYINNGIEIVQDGNVVEIISQDLPFKLYRFRTFQVFKGTPYPNPYVYNVDFEEVNMESDPSGGDVDPPTPEVLSIPYSLNSFQVDIVDTYNNANPLIIERTEINSPKLVYNGSDDRFQHLMTSELRFNMLVEDMTDANFLHLFTSDIGRFKVVLYEVSNDSNLNELLKVVWTGFLLPEQFSEPWHNGNYFVEFVATDNIALLKDEYFDDDFYKSNNHSISSVFSAAFSLVKMDAVMYYAPDFKNYYRIVRLSDLVVNIDGLRNYKKEDGFEKIDVYTILLEVIKSLNCKLFQYAGKWFLIGLSRFKDINFLFEKYDVTGDYVSQIVFNRPVRDVVFEQAPVVGVKPKLKKVEVDWLAKKRKNLLPDDVALQDKYNGYEGQIDFRYWQIQAINPTFILGLSSYKYPISSVLEDGDIIDQFASMNVNSVQAPWVFDNLYLTIAGDQVNVVDNYVYLINKPYLRGKIEDTKSVDLSIKFRAFFHFNDSFSEIQTAFDNGDFANSFKYKLFLNDSEIASSEMDDMNFKLSIYSWFKAIDGVLDLKGLDIKENGYLELRLYPVVSNQTLNVSVARLVFKDVRILYNFEKEKKTLTRFFDSKTSEKKSIWFKPDVITNTDRVLKLRDDFPFNPLSINVPGYTQEIPVTNYTIWSTPWSYLGVFHYATWDVSEESYNVLKYVKENQPIGVNVIKIEHNGVQYEMNGFEVGKIEIVGLPTRYLFKSSWYDFFDSNAQPPFLNGDRLFVDVPDSNDIITDANYILNHWSRFNYNDDKDWLELCAMSIHDSREAPRFYFDGNILGLVTPLDKLNFNFINDKSFVFTQLQLNLTEGISKAVMIEDINENVTNYVD